MSRMQLALNVSNIDEAVDFYRRLFGAEPAKRRPGHAVTCCYAVQDKFWVTGTDHREWEIHTVPADAPQPGAQATACCDSEHPA